MIDYFREGFMEGALSSTMATKSKAADAKQLVFHFFYIIVFYSLCHPIIYGILIVWESMQNAVLAVMTSEAASLYYEIKFSGSYIERIIVISSLAYIRREVYYNIICGGSGCCCCHKFFWFPHISEVKSTNERLK